MCQLATFHLWWALEYNSVSVVWQLKKTGCVSHSTPEAEIVAADGHESDGYACSKVVAADSQEVTELCVLTSTPRLS